MISYYQSIQAPGRSLTLSLLRGFVLPAALIYTLPAAFGTDVLWICHSAAEALTAAVCVILSRGTVLWLTSK